MQKTRLIARLDIKGPNLIKGVHLEGLRVIGSPNTFARKYYEEGIDELIFLDVVASLYGRNQLLEIIQEATKDIFIPLTVGGGINSVESARKVLRAGADKVALNSGAIRNPEVISEIATEFGSQCVVSYIEAKKGKENQWEVFYENGREPTGIDAKEWAEKCVNKGAGEILLTSIDREGTMRGFDVELIRTISSVVPVPVIASGGMGRIDDLVEVVETGGASAVAIASSFHYGHTTVKSVREGAIQAGLKVRPNS